VQAHDLEASSAGDGMGPPRGTIREADNIHSPLPDMLWLWVEEACRNQVVPYEGHFYWKTDFSIDFFLYQKIKMSSVMPASAYEDRYSVSQAVWYSRELAYNASQIHYYEEHLEKVLKLPQATPDDVKYIRRTMDVLWTERERLSEKYLKAVRENK
jgi:hypothetical protein